MLAVIFIYAALSQEAFFSFMGIFVSQIVILIIAIHNGTATRKASRNAESAATSSKSVVSQVVENHGASIKDAINRIEAAGQDRDRKLEAIAIEFDRFAHSSLDDRNQLRENLLRIAKESREDRQVIWEAIANQDRIGLLMRQAEKDRER